MGRPRLLLLDEPSLGLAPMIVQQIFEILRQIHQQQQIMILLVEQKAHLALQLADRGYLLENGKIQQTDTAANLLGNDDVRRAYLGR
jgi:branched-chain amino acid transport system ATP-binding protein